MYSVSQLRRSQSASESVSSEDHPTAEHAFTTAREREIASADLGKRIEAARKARGLNRNQLAKAVGSSWALVNRWEKGRTRPSVDSFLRLSQALNVGVHELMRGDGAAGSIELERFVRRWSPADVTESELRWLVAAPIPAELRSGHAYERILAVLRDAKRG